MNKKSINSTRFDDLFPEHKLNNLCLNDREFVRKMRFANDEGGLTKTEIRLLNKIYQKIK